MTRAVAPAAAMFTGATGNKLVGRRVRRGGAAGAAAAWRRADPACLEQDRRTDRPQGRVAYAIDQRGHGDSEWVEDGAYQFEDFADDARVLADTLARAQRRAAGRDRRLARRHRVAAGERRARQAASMFSALVLVDITPRVDSDGVAKIQGFMRAQIREGFGSIDEAADAVAAYLPHRPRPRSHEGLKKNLRLHPDGRWRWHWDPQIPRQATAGSGRAARRSSGSWSRPPAAPPSRRCWCAAGPPNWCGEEHARDFLEARAACRVRRCRRRPPHGGRRPQRSVRKRH